VKLSKRVLILLLCCSLARFTAQAESFGPTGQANEQQPAPLNGYMFRILTKQGPHAPGGAKNYVVNGKMTAGCAFVAYPVEYRSSGVMTFIVDESGTICQKDLGPDRTKLAQAVTVYDPDSIWHEGGMSNVHE